MSATLITWMTFASVTLLAVAVASWAHEGAFGYRKQLQLRVRSTLTASRASGAYSLFFDQKPIGSGTARNLAWLRDIYQECDVPVDWNTYRRLTVATQLSAALFLFLLTNAWWSIPLGLAFGAAPFVGYVFHKHNARKRKMLTQLPQAIDVISRAIQAGRTVPAAFQLVSEDLESPISDEFRRCYEHQQLGSPFDVALRKLAQRSPLMEVRIFVVALLVQARSGGNLIELLQDLSGLIQKRLKLEQRVKALTGEGRMQAAVLIVLPTAAFALLYVLAPSYVATLIENPLWIVIALIAQAVGALWIRRCIQIEY